MLKLGWILGFRASEYWTLTNNKVILSESIVDTIGLKYLYICVDDFQSNSYNSMDVTYNESIGFDKILCKINNNN